jgi:hypothetical protein
MQAGMRGSAHQKTTPHTPARKAHDSGSVCGMRAAALLCRALQATQCCVDLQRPPQTDTDTPGRKNTKAKSTRTTHRAQTRHIHPSHHHAKACMLQRKESGIPNKAACRPYRKSTFCHGSSCEVARIQQKGPYTLELRCNSVCVLCIGQHADNTGVCNKPTPQQSKAGRLTLRKRGEHIQTARAHNKPVLKQAPGLQGGGCCLGKHESGAGTGAVAKCMAAGTTAPHAYMCDA